MRTLFAQTFPAFSQMAPQEASFLGTLLADLLRAARKNGSARLAFHEYVLHHKSKTLIHLGTLPPRHFVLPQSAEVLPMSPESTATHLSGRASARIRANGRKQ
jgi:hypothetical protein